MIAMSKSFLDNSALSMMSKTYHFDIFYEGELALLNHSINARVIAVVVNETGCPELLLQSDNELPFFHPFDHLLVT